MKKYYSISEYPGNTGKYFYNTFFKKYSLNSTYIPLAATVKNFDKTFNTIVSDNSTLGISISMPFKQKVINFLDIKDSEVLEYNSCNTIKIENKLSTGYNTDIEGIKYILKFLNFEQKINILGNGSIGKMFFSFLKHNKYQHINLYSRNLGNWDQRHTDTDVIINCTALGTSIDSSPLEFLPKKVSLVIDLAIKPNSLMTQCFNSKINYVGGKEFYKHQFLKQFHIYTGIVINEQDYDEIAKLK